MDFPNHKTKIVATIGPSTNHPDKIEALLRAGMNVARLNFSHGEFDFHRETIRRLREASEKTGIDVAIMADLPGPKIRIGELEEEPVELQIGQRIVLTTDDIVGNVERVSINLENLPKAVKPEDKLFLNDGLISLKVVEVVDNDVVCEVRAGGELRSRKGVDLPGIDLGISAFTERDRECLAFALQEGVDSFSQSFVSDAADILALKDAANEIYGYSPFVIAKIERKQALDNIDEILQVADGIMVARGDLGVEIPISRMAVTQKYLMEKANRVGKPVITATQMLESMTEHRRPTRAEATDVANAILDGTDAVMLSAESAIGQYPIEAVEMLAEIAHETENSRSLVDPATLEDGTVLSLISSSIQHVVHTLKPAAVIVPTRTGSTARNVTSYRLEQWITAFTSQQSTVKSLQFSYGVYPVYIDREYKDWSPFVRQWLKKNGIEKGKAVLSQGPSLDNPSANHRMEIIDLSKG
ncbi:MAG: pyruvate kinase [Chromatiales bacterium]|nr:pyruvate kinase [Chromatiales bacterium]